MLSDSVMFEGHYWTYLAASRKRHDGFQEGNISILQLLNYSFISLFVLEEYLSLGNGVRLGNKEYNSVKAEVSPTTRSCLKVITVLIWPRPENVTTVFESEIPLVYDL